MVIAGVSTRAFAESAWRAGFICLTVDVFGDFDQKAQVPNVSFHRDLGRRYSAAAAAGAARRLSAGAAAYVANFENHPEAVRRLAGGRVLLGNAPDVLERVRDPFLLAEVVRSAGARMPLTLRPSEALHAGGGRLWLRKPMRGGGGSGVRPWQPGAPLRAHEIAQAYVDGVPASMVFLADGRHARLLGLSLQLASHSPAGAHPRGAAPSSPARTRASGFGAPPFIYAGNLYPLRAAHTDCSAGPAAWARIEDRAGAVAAAVTSAFELRGVNGIDFMLCDGELIVLEINPRYPASAELIERATGLSIFAAHVAACRGDLGPATAEVRAETPGRQPPRVWGKAILYARGDVVTGDTCTLLDDASFRDIPFPGDRIRRGRPVCTLFADGPSASTCRARLAAAAQRVDGLFAPANPA